MNQAFFNSSDIDIHAFDRVCSQSTDVNEYTFAQEIVQNVVVYEGDAWRTAIQENRESALRSELSMCLKDGPGIFVVRHAYTTDSTVIDRATQIFRQIVEIERTSGQGQGDHFGDNERIWNSMQKTCLADPDVFVDYYGNPILRLASESWVGPHYRVTAQMNNVKPGGKAQLAHRDYHLGFQSRETVSQFPAHAQIMSQFLTLQGAVAHCDMPIERGPTLMLPFSQQYAAGYMSYQLPEFAEYFQRHRVQLPLSKGDMVFFNPAVFHAGGSNTTDTDRVANLLQISSAFGRTMESLDHLAMIEAVYPVLLQRIADGQISESEVLDVIRVVADGYSFPTNLDSDPPIDGDPPETQQQIVSRALKSHTSANSLRELLLAYEVKRSATARSATSPSRARRTT